MNPLKVGLIGLGEVAQVMHLPLMDELSQLYKIQGIYDISPSLLDYVARRYRVPQVFDSAEALMASPEIELILILSPDHMHRPQLLQALKSGKAVFIEKPICLNTDEVKEILAAPVNAFAMVGYMRRYAQSFLKLKELLKEAAPIQHVHIRDVICEGPYFLRQTNSVFYPKDLPKDALEQGRQSTHDLIVRGAGTQDPVKLRAYQILTGLGVHSLSAMRELLGYPKRVAFSSIQKGGDCILVVFEYEGFNAVYETLTDNVVRFDARIEVFTDRTLYELKYDSPYVRNLPTHLHVTTSTDHDTQTTHYGPFYEDPFRSELHYLYNCISQQQRPKTTLQDATEDIRLINEIAHTWS